MINKVLITGAAGYLAGFIIDQLKDKYSLTLFDRITMDTTLPFIQGDICDYSGLADACRGQDAVVHTVALVRGRQTKPLDAFADVVVKGTWNVLDLCAQQQIKRLVNISSIVADGSSPQSDTPLLPGAASQYNSSDLYYCISKKLGEVLSDAYTQAHSLSVIHLRPGVIAGDGANPGPEAPDMDINRPWFVYVDPRDVAQAVGGALATQRQTGTYAIVAGRGDSLFDWRPAAQQIDYTPQYNWPDIAEVEWQKDATE